MAVAATSGMVSAKIAWIRSQAAVAAAAVIAADFPAAEVTDIAVAVATAAASAEAVVVLAPAAAAALVPHAVAVAVAAAVIAAACRRRLLAKAPAL